MAIGGGKDLYDASEPTEQNAARSHTVARPPPTPGPAGANKKQQEEEEDPPPPSEQEEFSKTEERVIKAIPRRYDEDSSPPTIYVVPRDLAEGTKDAYEPAVVCIGPLFPFKARDEERCRKLEHYKWCCVRKLIVNAEAGLGRKGAWIPDVHTPLLRMCLKTMRDLEPQIRDSYGSIFMDDVGGSNGLALMMLLDGCFVLHRLLNCASLARRSAGGREKEEDDDDDDWTQVFGRRGVWGIVTRDLLLLKNQIPFFLVRALFKHLKSRASERDDVLVEGGLRLFASLRPRPRPDSASTISCRNVHHLLHLFYLSIDIGPTRPLPRPESSEPQHALPVELQGWMPCAMELEEAGVSLRAKNKKQQPTSFLDLSFHGGVLEIPPVELYDYSEALFRNLIAFEQTYLHAPAHVTAYAIFMDCLIKTRNDMRHLHQSGVLVSHMNGERDVATGFFSRVCAQTHISSDQNYLHHVMGAVVRYQSQKWPRWQAALARNYFSNPWVITSVVAASFLLLMTVLQTFFGVYSYFKPPGSN